MGSAVPRVQILSLPSKIFSMDHLAENGKIEDSALTFGQAWSRITRDLVSHKGPGNVHTEEHGTVGVFHEFRSKEDKRSHWNVHCESGNPQKGPPCHCTRRTRQRGPRCLSKECSWACPRTYLNPIVFLPSWALQKSPDHSPPATHCSFNSMSQQPLGKRLCS